MKPENKTQKLKKEMKNRIKDLYNRIFYNPKSLSELYNWWNTAEKGRPETCLLSPKEKSYFLLKKIKKLVGEESKILEIGCNAGRNLNILFENNFHNLVGVDLQERAITSMKEAYPSMYDNIIIFNKPIEEIIFRFKDNEFDVVFTLATLMHIHTDINFIFPEIARITKKYLIIIEAENCYFWRTFPRNYKKVFERLGFEQIESKNCKEIKELTKTYTYRVFKKK